VRNKLEELFSIVIGMLFVLGGSEYDGGVHPPGVDCCYSSKSVKLTWQATSCHSSMMSFQSFSSCAVSIHSERGACWDTCLVLEAGFLE
jgi:hypothetical protein